MLPAKYVDGVRCPLECTLFTASLDAIPNYDALSYVWGDQSNPSQILLNENVFSITENLGEALLELQSSMMPQRLWVDAICINQADMKERSEQVIKMRQIFQLASSTIAWLGPATRDSELAFSLLSQLEKQQHQKCNCIEDSNARCSTVSHIILHSKNFIALQALGVLFSRDYWQRVWIVQEVVMARSVIILCGKSSIRWSSLSAIQRMLKRDTHRKDLDKISHRNPYPFGVFRTLLSTGGPFSLKGNFDYDSSSLLDTLVFHAHKQATDARDKVFALVQLTGARNDGKLVISYEKSVKEVYTDVVIFVVTTTNQLDIICARPRQDHKKYNLPSWVPSWEFSGDYDAELIVSMNFYSAAAKTKADVKFSEDRNILVAKGFCLGTVTNCSSPPSSTKTSFMDIPNAISTFHSWHQLVADTRGTSVAQQEALCRTALRGNFSEDLWPRHTCLSYTLQAILGSIVRKSQVLCPDIDIDDLLLQHAEKGKEFKNLEDLDSYHVKQLSQCIYDHRIFFTSSKLMGLTRNALENDDIVCILLGCASPIALRPLNGDFVLLGSVYIDEYMFGKGINEYDQGQYKLKEFRIL
jgi:hypothetical protein